MQALRCCATWYQSGSFRLSVSGGGLRASSALSSISLLTVTRPTRMPTILPNHIEERSIPSHRLSTICRRDPVNGLRLGGQGVYDLVNKVAVVAGCSGGIGAAAGPAIRRRWSDRGSRLPPGRCPGRSNHGG